MKLISKLKLLARLYKAINYYYGFIDMGRIEFDRHGVVKSITTKYYELQNINRD